VGGEHVKVLFKDLELSTRSQTELVDITRYVEEYTRESGIQNGFCLVYAPHATIAIIANEHESGLIHDMLNKVERDYPRGAGWHHDRIDDNASAHLASAFISSSRIFPVRKGRLVRGTWQNIFLVELDGPRAARKIVIEVLGE